LFMIIGDKNYIHIHSFSNNDVFTGKKRSREDEDNHYKKKFRTKNNRCDKRTKNIRSFLNRVKKSLLNLIKRHLVNDNLNEAEKEFRRNKYLQNKYHYTMLIDGYATKENYKKVEELFNEMKNSPYEECKPDDVTYHIFIDSLYKHNRSLAI